MNNLQQIAVIDSHILSFLRIKKKEAQAFDSHLGSFIDILIEYLKSGGKHIRSLLFYKAYLSGKNGKSESNIEKVAGVFELFQAFALIHDDIIDKEQQRRGNPTVHEKYGVPTALLIGNLALMYCDEILSLILEENNFLHKKQILELFQKYKQEVMWGQYLDIHNAGSLQTIVNLKTSQYTFVKPVTMGILFANETESEITFWSGILNQIGDAFQLKDDYNNLFLSSKVQGKDRLSDIQEGKKTVLIELFTERAGRSEIHQFETIFNKGALREQDKNWLVEIMIKLNIKKDIEAKITYLCNRAIHNLIKNNNKSELTTYIFEIVDSIKT